jgi:predicted DNA-binding protein
VPNQPRTQHRSIRIPDEIYYPAMEKAKSEGRTVSEVVREFLAEYIDENEN